MKKTVKLLMGSSLLFCAINANAGTFHFTGNISYHNDVIYTYFTLNNDATNVRVWTDSFLNGANFDPITALWNATTGNRLAENDDNEDINPATQTYYDSGFSFSSLAAGNYVFTVAAFDNFAANTNLSDPGFGFSNEAPIALAEWCQPANSCGMGSYWSVWLDGVDDATNPNDPPPVSVPEPSVLLLLSLGLGGLAMRRKQA